MYAYSPPVTEMFPDAALTVDSLTVFEYTSFIEISDFSAYKSDNPMKLPKTNSWSEDS